MPPFVSIDKVTGKKSYIFLLSLVSISYETKIHRGITLNYIFRLNRADFNFGFDYYRYLISYPSPSTTLFILPIIFSMPLAIEPPSILPITLPIFPQRTSKSSVMVNLLPDGIASRDHI